MEPLKRQEILSILTKLGVELPPATRLPDEALKKRLQQGLQAAQSSSRVLQTAPINPMVLPAWQGADKSVHEAIKRVNFSKAYTNYQRMRRGQDITPELFVNPVMDLDKRSCRSPLRGIKAIDGVSFKTQPLRAMLSISECCRFRNWIQRHHS